MSLPLEQHLAAPFLAYPDPFTGGAAAHKEDEDEVEVEVELESSESDESCHGISCSSAHTQADKTTSAFHASQLDPNKLEETTQMATAKTHMTNHRCILRTFPSILVVCLPMHICFVRANAYSVRM